jgi:hypothetical protein
MNQFVLIKTHPLLKHAKVAQEEPARAKFRSYVVQAGLQALVIQPACGDNQNAVISGDPCDVNSGIF